MKNYYITIRSEYGSGGRYIAKTLAEKLNLPYYDVDVIRKTAEESGMCETIVSEYDEKKEGYFRNAVVSFPITNMSVQQKVYLAQTEVIKKFADNGPCIIVGRCADYVLKDYDNVISIFITASEEEKKKRVINDYNIAEKDAEDQIKKVNKQRKNYYQHHTHKKWGDYKDHNLMVSSDIGIEQTVDVMHTYVKNYLMREKIC